MNNICKLCNKEFHVKPSHAEKRVYCSRSCMAKAYQINLTGENNPNHKGNQKTCETCGKLYTSYIKTSKFCCFCGIWKRVGRGRVLIWIALIQMATTVKQIAVGWTNAKTSPGLTVYGLA
jgi:hypothetical protein